MCVGQERSRREIWSIARFGKSVVREDGTTLAVTAELIEDLLHEVLKDIQDDTVGRADVPFNEKTKVSMRGRLRRWLFTVKMADCIRYFDGDYYGALHLTHAPRLLHGAVYEVPHRSV